MKAETKIKVSKGGKVSIKIHKEHISHISKICEYVVELKDKFKGLVEDYHVKKFNIKVIIDETCKVKRIRNSNKNGCIKESQVLIETIKNK